MKIYFISAATSYNHQIGAMKMIKYPVEILNFNDSKKLDYNQEDFYFISCLPYSEKAKYFINLKKESKIKNLIIHCSGNVDFISKEILNFYDLIFYETEYTYKNSYLKYHKNAIKSFGIDTKIFSNNLEKNKIYDYIWVGSINDSLKKFSLIEESCEINSKILMVGNINSEKDQFLIEKLRNKYIIDIRERCDLEKLKYYYSISKCCLLTQPEYGGGERCLLEAKYLGLEIKIVKNKKLEMLLNDDTIYDLNYFSSQINKGLDKLICK